MLGTVTASIYEGREREKLPVGRQGVLQGVRFPRELQEVGPKPETHPDRRELLLREEFDSRRDALPKGLQEVPDESGTRERWSSDRRRSSRIWGSDPDRVDLTQEDGTVEKGGGSSKRARSASPTEPELPEPEPKRRREEVLTAADIEGTHLAKRPAKSRKKDVREVAQELFDTPGRRHFQDYVDMNRDLTLGSFRFSREDAGDRGRSRDRTSDRDSARDRAYDRDRSNGQVKEETLSRAGRSSKPLDPGRRSARSSDTSARRSATGAPARPSASRTLPSAATRGYGEETAQPHLTGSQAASKRDSERSRPNKRYGSRGREKKSRREKDGWSSPNSDSSDSDAIALRNMRRLLSGKSSKGAKKKERKNLSKIKAWLRDPTRGAIPLKRIWSHFKPLAVEESSEYKGSVMQFSFVFGHLAELCEDEGMNERARDLIIFRRVADRLRLQQDGDWTQVKRVMAFWLEQIERDKATFRKLPDEATVFLAKISRPIAKQKPSPGWTSRAEPSQSTPHRKAPRNLKSFQSQVSNITKASYGSAAAPKRRRTPPKEKPRRKRGGGGGGGGGDRRGRRGGGGGGGSKGSGGSGGYHGSRKGR
jgi:uncharacterized membrane protein YgcG